MNADEVKGSIIDLGDDRAALANTLKDWDDLSNASHIGASA